MTHTAIWNLYHSDSTDRLAEWDNSEMDVETVVCPTDEGHQRGGKRLTDLSILLPGNVVEDFVWTWYSECLIQDHVLDRFRAERLTGVGVKPVRAKFKDACRRKPPKLWELVVTGWAGMAPRASGIALDQKCEACGYTTYKGLRDPSHLIEESQWDGSDVFIVWPLPAFIFVTDRVADLIRNAEWNGVVPRPVNDMTPTQGYAPGRLSYYMPEPRARILGEPLGIH